MVGWILAVLGDDVAGTESSTQPRVLWLRKFGYDTAYTSQVMDRLALYGICVVSLADQFYFTADAIARQKRLAWYRAIKTVSSVIIFAAFLALAFLVNVALSVSPITIPTESIAIVVIAGIILSLFLRVLFSAIHHVVFEFIMALLTGVFAIAESARMKLIRKGLKPQRYEQFLRQFKKSVDAGESHVFRVDDDCWQDAVRHAISEVDLIVIDVSQLTDNIMWEVNTAFNEKETSRIRLLVSENALYDPARVETINSLMSRHYLRNPLAVLVYGRESNDESAHIIHAHVTGQNTSESCWLFPLAVLDVPVRGEAMAVARRSRRRRR